MRKILFFIGFILIFLLFPSPSFAEVIHSFNTNITAHKDGTMDVTETINYDFQDSIKHGIFRDIPLYSKVGDLYRNIEIKNIIVLRDSQAEKFLPSNDAKNLNIKIGDANKTITGVHSYIISYKVLNGIGSNFADHDEIYWNGTGNAWKVDIEKAEIKVDTDFATKPTRFICFEGPLGSNGQTCNISKNSSTNSNSLYPTYGLTIVAVFPVGTFPKSILSKEAPHTNSEAAMLFIFKNIFYIFVFFNIILPVVLIFWYQKHKNKKRFGAPTVNFDIPKDEKGERLAPALAGTIDSAKLERDDIVATIFDLAIRKYIKLEEKKTVRSLLPDSTTQTIIKLKKADGKLKPFEKNLFDFIFETGDRVNVSDLKLTFYKAYQKVEEDVFKTLVEKGYYAKNPKVQKVILITLGIIAFSTFNIFLAIALLFISIKLNGRKALGDEMDYKIDGLKLFLKAMDRNYKWQAEKFYTVEQMIPYAMALGYIDKFMEQLKIINPDYSPSWYSGYSGSFYVAYAGFYSSMSTTVAPSSSSGAGGGGFSGGGGGGGGGGSW